MLYALGSLYAWSGEKQGSFFRLCRTQCDPFIGDGPQIFRFDVKFAFTRIDLFISCFSNHHGSCTTSDFLFNTIREEIKIRMNFAKYGAKMKGVERYVRTFNQLAFVGTIGFNVASAMVQTAQTPMFTYPMLGARYGYKNAYNEIMNATSFVTGARGYGETKLDKIAVAHGLDAYYDITDNGDFVVKKEKDKYYRKRTRPRRPGKPL